MNVVSRLVRDWYAPRLTAFTFALTPFSMAFALATALRRALYRVGALRSHRLPVPVIVVGNLTVGGSGKTPFVIALARELAARGFHPGIVSRGYGGDKERHGDASPLLVSRDDDANVAGDEPLLIARSGFPVAVARDRVAAGRRLLAAQPDCNAIIADDGLQHYALARDFEIVVVDGKRAFGNGWRLPAGPLREGPDRLRSVDAVVTLIASDSAGENEAVRHPANEHSTQAYRMSLTPESFRRVNAPQLTATAGAFRGPGVHAVAGIGNPRRFFDQLRSLGIDATAHPFPDHHRFSAHDLQFAGASAVLMTEKDAVKCTTLADERCWYLPVHAELDSALVERVEEKLRGCQTA